MQNATLRALQKSDTWAADQIPQVSGAVSDNAPEWQHTLIQHR